ncbi:MAG: MBOAT family protein [Defluviitaleaceae bacterium]|nr:MBOAT family protein [Defluviitaleaceae bacterium]MCL2273996.1 MBOAT family protein [Defluviitaleaceae bacterium]MCL2274103.1 MBOAT family protein [Defluviitaleaceae bacterium]
MVFSSLTFLVFFLPAFLIAYFSIPKKYLSARNFVLLIFSLFFYAAGEPAWVVLIIFSASMDCLIGLFMERYHGKWQAKALLVLSMCSSLGLLIIFKYTEFFLGIFGISVTFAPGLPIGISFYTFQTMSYTIDLYRGKVKAQRNPIAFLTFVCMFPQLVAGPIVRYSDVAAELTKREITVPLISQGISRFIMGLGKKIIFANHAGLVAAELLGSPYASTLGIWLGAIMFMFQIYFDFSAYSDMAIGLGKIIGFNFLENFDYPYVSKSITDFWRRWHISLGRFFRDYLYIPLGGNRKRAVFNIMFVWAATGLWHGASFNFILWGMYFGVILLIEKYLLNNFLQKLPAFFAHLYCLFVVLYGWILFYFTDFAQLGTATARFFGFGGSWYDYRAVELLMANVWVLPILAIFSTRAPIRILHYVKERMPVAEPMFNFGVACVSFVLLIGQTFTPFIYFRF